MGAKNTGYAGSKTFLKLKAKTSDTDPSPKFFKSEKQGDTWAVVDSFNAIDGELTSIQHTTYEYEGKTKDKCIMVFKDPDGSETNVDANFSGLLYTILNSLCSLTNFDGIEISVWLGKAKELGGKQYPSAGLKQYDERVGWAYKYEVLPKPKVEEYKGHKITDDTEVIAFWKDRIDELQRRITEKKGSVPPPPVTEGEQFHDMPEDDLPF